MTDIMSDTIYGIIIIAVTMFFVALIAAMTYDIITRRRINKAAAPRTKPHITVIVLNNSSFEQTVMLLQSISKSSYRKYDVVLVDNVSGRKDFSKHRTYKSSLKQKLRVYKRRRRTAINIAVSEAYKKSQRGEIVLVLDSVDHITPQTLRNISYYFTHDPAAQVLHLNDGSMYQEEGIVGLLTCFEDMFHRAYLRLQALVRVRHESSGIIACGYTFRGELLKPYGKPKSTKVPVAYYEDARKTVEPDAAFGRRLRVRGRVAIGASLLIGSLGYALARMAIDGSGLEVFVITWAAVTICIASLLAVDTTLSVRQKADTALFLGIFPLLAIASLALKRTPRR